MTDTEIRLLHTLVCAPPFDLLVFYVFRERLRFARGCVLVGYLLLLVLTQGIQMTAGLDMSLTALLCRPLAVLYMTATIHDRPLRVLSIALLVYPLLMLAGSSGGAVLRRRPAAGAVEMSARPHDVPPRPARRAAYDPPPAHADAVR